MRNATRLFPIVALLATAHIPWVSSDSARGADSLIINGDFLKWTDGLPDGWQVEVGATNGGDLPKSEVKPIKGPALILRGDASTLAWHLVSQQFPTRSGESYSLEFESRVKGVKREGRQYNNCYVGIMCLDAADNPIEQQIEDLSGDSGWTSHRITAKVPPHTASAKVVIFLSKTGILGVRNVSITKAQPTDLPKNLLANSDFADWNDGLPSGWTVDIGANNGGEEPQSEVKRVNGPGLSLRGSGSTMAWHSVSQRLSLDQGSAYRLEFQARSDNVRRQGRQFDNCYVGVMILDASGERVGMSIKDLSRNTGWRRQRIDFKVPAGADQTEVIVFLSKTGTLTVKNLLLRRLSAD